MQNKNSHTNRYSNFLPSTRFSHSQLSAGFTVLEMIVVISIFSIFAGITMANFGAFKNNTDFAVSVQEVALLIKEQQQTAMAGKLPAIDPNLKDYPATDWKPAYGVYFNLASPNKMIKFYDNNSDYLLSSGPNVVVPPCYGDATWSPQYECISVTTFDKIQLYKICSGQFTGPNTCSGGSGLHPQFSAVFRRPFPDAHMSSNNSLLGVSVGPQTITSSVDLVFKSSDISGSCSVININPIGAISVRKESCT